MPRMASLRTTALAARFVRGAPPRILPATRRFQSYSSSGGELATQDSTLDLEAHKGDHTVTVDKATSYELSAITAAWVQLN
jgi:hypothetical protein